MAIEELKTTSLCDRYGNCYGHQYPTNKELMYKINEIITYINNKEAVNLTKNSKNMRIYYLNGNKTRGIDLTSQLEDISINLQKQRALLKVGAPLRIAKCKSIQDCVDWANEEGYKLQSIHPNPKAIEGEHEDRLYYLHKYVIKWCKKRSLKALLIRLIGVNIEKL